MKKIKIALIGYGHLGKWHAQKLSTHPECDFIGIVDPSENSRALANQNHPLVKTFSNLSDILEEIDAAVVVTPTTYHYDVVKTLIQNDKHVFCEKPVTSTLTQSQDLKKELGDRKLVVQVGHSERCHQIWEDIAKYDFATKNPKVVTLKRTSPFKGRAADVGVVEDLMIHDIDIARMLFGDPVSVYAKGAKVNTKNFDHVLATLKYSDKLVMIEGSRVDVEVHRSISFVADHGILKIDLMGNKIHYSKDISSNSDQLIQESNYEKRDHLLIEQQKFVKSIIHGAPVFVSLEDGIDAIKIIDAINSSLKSGEEVKL